MLQESIQSANLSVSSHIRLAVVPVCPQPLGWRYFDKLGLVVKQAALLKFLTLLLTLTSAALASDLHPILPEAPSQSILRSKSFLLPHASMFLSIGFDGEMSRNLAGHACHEGNPKFRTSNGDFKAGRFYAYNLSMAAGITMIDYLLRRRFSRNRWVKDATIAVPLGAVPFGTVEHVWGGLTWVGCL